MFLRTIKNSFKDTSVLGEKNEAQLALEHCLSSDYVKKIVKLTQLKTWQAKIHDRQ